jgi:putative Mn2+ efflux pump MntP
MELWTTLLLAIGLAMDALTVSISSGMIIKHIHINKALKIALFFGIFQGIMPIFGWLGGLTFKDLIAGYDHWIAFILLCLIGGKMIYESQQMDEEIKKYDPLDNYTLFVLAIATSIDALAAGLGLTMIGNSIYLAATFIAIVTFIFSFIGVFVGHKFGNFFNKNMEIIGGLILIFIGSKILFEHLS